MKILCEKCEKVINRDKSLAFGVVEVYNNIYGTCCPHCGHIIKPFKKVQINKDRELKMEILREEMRDRLRKEMRDRLRKK